MPIYGRTAEDPVAEHELHLRRLSHLYKYHGGETGIKMAETGS